MLALFGMCPLESWKPLVFSELCVELGVPFCGPSSLGGVLKTDFD